MEDKIQGRLAYIGKAEVITERFSKLDFAIQTSFETKEGAYYEKLYAFQLTNAQTALIDGFRLGEEIVVSYRIRSNKSEKDGIVRFFTSLIAHNISRAYVPPVPKQPQPEIRQTEIEEFDEPLPF